MSLIMIILAIVQAIPEVIKIIQMIMDLIHGKLKGSDKRAAEKDLHKLLSGHLGRKNDGKCQKDLEAFHSDLKGKYGV